MILFNWIPTSACGLLWMTGVDKEFRHPEEAAGRRRDPDPVGQRSSILYFVFLNFELRYPLGSRLPRRLRLLAMTARVLV